MGQEYRAAALGAAIGLAMIGSALPAAAEGRHGLVQVQYDRSPCTDGRYSDGRPRSCDELLDWLDRRRVHEGRRDPVDPCTDGRFSDGRPRSCGELLDWLDRDRRRPWR